MQVASIDLAAMHILSFIISCQVIQIVSNDTCAPNFKGKIYDCVIECYVVVYLLAMLSQGCKNIVKMSYHVTTRL